MALFDKIFQRAEKFDPVHPKDPGLSNLFKGLFSNTSSGISVRPDESALSITAVYSAVNIISETIAILPWELYRVGDSGKTKVELDPRYRLLNRKPNRFQNTIEYRTLMMIVFLLRGRAVAEIISNPRGEITDLIPLHPDDITPFKAPNGTIAFEHRPNGGKRRILLADEVIDIRGMTIDGVNCVSPIEANEETLGIAKASELFGARYFGNGTVVSGILETDEALSDKAYKRLQEWTERHQGIGRSHNPAILEEGLKWKPVTVSPEAAQLLQTRSYSVEEVARIYRIPAYKLNRMDSVKFNTTEQQAIDFVTDTILPHVRRLELTHDMALLTESQQRRMKSEIVLRELLRGDSKTRVEFNKGMFNMGASSPDEIRASEGMNPQADGQGNRYYIPVNMVPADKVDEMLENKTRPQPTVQGDQGPDNEQPRSLRPFVRSIMERIVNAELNAASRGKDMVKFYTGYKDFIQRNAAPLVEFIGDDVNEYLNEFYLNTLKGYESRGAVDSDENRVNIETENLLTWIERQCLSNTKNEQAPKS